MKATKARELTNKNNTNIESAVLHVDIAIAQAVSRGECTLRVDHMKHNNMSTGYWKHVVEHYRQKGYKVNFGNIISLYW